MNQSSVNKIVLRYFPFSSGLFRVFSFFCVLLFFVLSCPWIYPTSNFLNTTVLSLGAIFTVWSHTFFLFWLRKTSVIVETFQLNFRVFMCAFHPENSSFFRWEFPLSFFIFVLSVFRYFPFPRGLKILICKKTQLRKNERPMVDQWLLGERSLQRSYRSIRTEMEINESTSTIIQLRQYFSLMS